MLLSAVSVLVVAQSIFEIPEGLMNNPVLLVKLSDFTVWRQTWRKNWVNCVVLTGNSAGLRTVLSSRLSQKELRSSLRESYSFLSLPAHTTMASSQGTPFLAINSADEHRVIYSFSNTTSFSTFYAFFSDNIMADVASKQQTTELFLSTTVTRTRRHTELTNLMGNLCCAREHSVQFFVQIFYTVNLHSLT